MHKVEKRYLIVLKAIVRYLIIKLKRKNPEIIAMHIATLSRLSYSYFYQ